MTSESDDLVELSSLSYMLDCCYGRHITAQLRHPKAQIIIGLLVLQYALPPTGPVVQYR